MKSGKKANRPRQAETKAKPVVQKHREAVSSLLAGLVICSAAFILYGYSISFGYVLDDEMVITKNVYVQKGLEGAKDIFRSDSFLGYFQSTDQLYLLEGGRYRPLSLFTFAAEIAIFGKDQPHVSHFINILLYALTGMILFSLSKKLLKNITMWDRSIFALTAAIIWIIHPVHTECVSNIKGRDEILALMGGLAALWFMIKHADTRRTAWKWASAFFLMLGLLSKENTITFVVIIPLTLWFFRHVQFKEAVKSTIPLFAAAVLFIYFRYEALGYMFDHGRAVKNLLNDPFMDMTVSEKYATIAFSAGYYLKLLIFPHPLTHDYYPYHFPKMNWSDPAVIVSLIVYSLLLVVALYSLRRRSFYSYCILFFIISLSITSNIVFSVGTFLNERFLYTPSVAFALAVSYFSCYTLREAIKPLPAWKTTVIVMAVIFGGFFSYKTFARVPDWKDSLSLDKAAINVSPNSARANCFYGVSLYKIYMQSKDDAVKAKLVDSMEVYFDKAISIYPSYDAAWQMKAGVAGIRYQQNKDVNRLLHEFENAMKEVANHKITREFVKDYIKYIYPRHPSEAINYCYNIGYNVLYKQNKDTVYSIEFLQLGLEKDPNNMTIINAINEIRN